MFVIKPVKERNTQKEICEKVGVDFDAETLAYYAAELDSDFESITEYIGICQFRLGGEGRIVSLAPAKSKENDEAMIILLKTVMRFMCDAGCEIMTMKINAGPKALLDKCFLPESNGKYTVNLKKYFESPCSFNENTVSGS